MKEINSIVRTVLKPILKDYSPVILIMRRNWLSIIGEKYYEFCEPEKIFFKKGKKNVGLLYIKCFNAIISFYIENNKTFIQEKINSIFGYKLIGDIKIKQSPKIIKQYIKETKKIKIEDEEKINKSLEKLECDELKRSLKNLGNSIFLKNNL